MYEKQPRSKIWLIVLIVGLFVLLGAAAFWYFVLKSNKTEDKTSTSKTTKSSRQIPESNKFGWLGGSEGNDDFEFITSAGGGWMRPHPGPAVWDIMQESDSSKIDFSAMDKLVKTSQQYGVNLMITLWPYAEWDQKSREDFADCAVESNDEFLPQNDEKGRTSYLPEHRCNPSNWDAYQTWVSKVVERYDGDGNNDMDGLSYGIKYWEVMNEPDLAWGSTAPIEETRSLNFYKQEPADYGVLLQKTYEAVKESDSKAKVLIAGAAGGSDNFLKFYSDLFSEVGDVSNFFDAGNVHCISNDSGNDFNVSAYKKILSDAGIVDKPIWVTEAENINPEGTAEENYESTKTSTEGALAAGAVKIFFTRYSFADSRTDMSKVVDEGEKSFDDSIKLYKELISSVGN